MPRKELEDLVAKTILVVLVILVVIAFVIYALGPSFNQ